MINKTFDFSNCVTQKVNILLFWVDIIGQGADNKILNWQVK